MTAISRIGYALTVTCAVIAFSAMAIAEDEPSAGQDHHPCAQIMRSCKAAGYYKGGWKQGKGLFKNCMKPIMSGQSVQGVTVEAGLVQACQAKRAERKERKS